MKNIQLFKALSEDTRYRIIKVLLEVESKFNENKYGAYKEDMCLRAP